MAQNANITVYLQALGAHYLGAHAYLSSDITISLVYSEIKVQSNYPILSHQISLLMEILPLILSQGQVHLCPLLLSPMELSKQIQ